MTPRLDATRGGYDGGAVLRVPTRPRRRVACLLMVVLIASAGYAFAQLRGGVFDGFGVLRGEQGDPAELPPHERPDGNLAGCHMLYRSVRREANGNGWRTDYPWGQRNLLIRLSERRFSDALT
jgi:hypothetical protein